MALQAAGKVVVDWEAKIDRYISDLTKAKDLEAFMRKAREKDFKAQEKHWDQVGKAVNRTGKEAQALGEKWGRNVKEVSFLNQGLDVAGKRLKAMGTSLISGLGSGLIGGVLGGGVSSVVQTLFAPLTDDQIQQMARGTEQFVFLGDATKDLTRALIEKNKASELEKQGRTDAQKAVEAVTHADAKRVLLRAEIDLDRQLKHNEITQEVHRDAVSNLRIEYARATGAATDFTAELIKQGQVLGGGLLKTLNQLGDPWGTPLFGGAAWDKLGADYDKKQREKERRREEAKREREREAERIAEFDSFDYQQRQRAEAERLAESFGREGEMTRTARQASEGYRAEVLQMQREIEKEQTEAQIKLNEKLAETYMGVGSAVQQLVQAFAEGGMSGEKAAKMLTRILLNSVRDRALAEAKLQFGLAAIPPGNPAAFAAGIALTAAAGLAGGLAGRWGGGGSGGGGGGGGGAPSYAGHLGQGGSGGVTHVTHVHYGDVGATRTERDRRRDAYELAGRASGANGVRDG